MALKFHKWTPETFLRGVNFGDGEIEFTTFLTGDESQTGKVFILPPRSEQFIQVKDLLPATVKDLSVLNGETLSFQSKNTGTMPTKFNLFDEGPFKSEAATRTYPNPWQRMVAIYEEMIEESDFYCMKQVVKQPVPESYKKNKGFYSGICYLRGKMLCSLLRIPEADAEYEAGWVGCYDHIRWFFCFDWAWALGATLMVPNAGVEQKGKALQKAVEILSRARQWTKGMKYEKYHIMTGGCLKAFMLCYLGEEKLALAEFDDFDFTPLPEADYNAKELNTFFGYLAFGFWAALEMKNTTLLRNLSSIISTGFPDMLREPSPVRCFRRAFGNADQKGRNQLNIAVNNLTLNGHLYAPEMPNLREFIKLLTQRNDKILDRFIGYVE